MVWYMEKIAKLEAENATANQVIKDLTQMNEEIRKKFDFLNTGIHTLQTENADLKSQISWWSEEGKKWTTEKEDLKAKCHDLEEASKSLRIRWGGLFSKRRDTA